MPREHPAKTIAVIGAGVTGLTTAYALRKLGHKVVILERSDRPGGAIRSMRRDGFLVEAGPNTMLLNSQATLDFFTELGIGSELVDAAPGAKNRFIVRGGVPVAAPSSAKTFFKTMLLSRGAKWRLFREPFVRRADPNVEESVAAFTRRRLGPEIVDYAINPLIAGIYAGDPERLSMRYAFPMLYRFDREHGSLLRGAIASRRARKKSGVPRFKSRSISFRAGLQTIIDALVHQVGDSLFTQVAIESIERDSHWRVRFARAGETATDANVDAVIVTTPAYAAAELPFAAEIARPFGALADVVYPPVTSVALGFQRDQVAHALDGYGALVPAKENFRVLGTLFNSTLFPERAPNGCVLLTSFIGGMRHPELASLSADQLRDVVLEDLRRLLGVKGEPLFMHVTAWPRAIPQYNLGYGKFHDVMDAAEKRFPGLFIGGHCRDGVSVGDCIKAGFDLAERVNAVR